MADIQFNCPECSQGLTIDERATGQSVVCPYCSKSIVVPKPESKSEPMPMPIPQFSPAPKLEDNGPVVDSDDPVEAKVDNLLHTLESLHAAQSDVLKQAQVAIHENITLHRKLKAAHREREDLLDRLEQAKSQFEELEAANTQLEAQKQFAEETISRVNNSLNYAAVASQQTSEFNRRLEELRQHADKQASGWSKVKTSLEKTMSHWKENQARVAQGKTPAAAPKTDLPPEKPSDAKASAAPASASPASAAPAPAPFAPKAAPAEPAPTPTPAPAAPESPADAEQAQKKTELEGSEPAKSPQPVTGRDPSSDFTKPESPKAAAPVLEPPAPEKAPTPSAPSRPADTGAIKSVAPPAPPKPPAPPAPPAPPKAAPTPPAPPAPPKPEAPKSAPVPPAPPRPPAPPGPPKPEAPKDASKPPAPPAPPKQPEPPKDAPKPPAPPKPEESLKKPEPPAPPEKKEEPPADKKEPQAPTKAIAPPKAPPPLPKGKPPLVGKPPAPPPAGSKPGSAPQGKASPLGPPPVKKPPQAPKPPPVAPKAPSAKTVSDTSVYQTGRKSTGSPGATPPREPLRPSGKAPVSKVETLPPPAKSPIIPPRGQAPKPPVPGGKPSPRKPAKPRDSLDSPNTRAMPGGQKTMAPGKKPGPGDTNVKDVWYPGSKPGVLPPPKRKKKTAAKKKRRKSSGGKSDALYKTPKKKGNLGKTLGILGGGLLLIGGLGGGGWWWINRDAGDAATGAESAATAAETQTQVVAPAQPEEQTLQGIGSSVTIDGIQVSLEGIRIESSTELSTSGRPQLILDVLLKNTSPDQSVFLLNTWNKSKLKDDLRNVAWPNEVNTAGSSATDAEAAELSPGQIVQDVITFDAPEDVAQAFTLTSDPGFWKETGEDKYQPISPSTFSLAFGKDEILVLE